MLRVFHPPHSRKMHKYYSPQELPPVCCGGSALWVVPGRYPIEKPGIFLWETKTTRSRDPGNQDPADFAGSPAVKLAPQDPIARWLAVNSECVQVED